MLAPKAIAAEVRDREEELLWLALRLVPGLGTRKAAQLIERLRSVEAIFRSSPSQLEALGVPASVAQSIASGCSFEDAVAQQEKMAATGVVLIPIADPRYPATLREIYDPPVVLFARGRLELLGTLKLAVVGTRRPTPYGVAVTERFAGELARTGLTVVSGMARGIDTAAHRGALAAGGDTMAVFGCGVDIVYPSENRRLMEELANKGLVLSEFPLGSPAHPQNFPIRNRVISGLSLGVLVVEGAQYSGSAITARMAMDQGREVFAVPGNITSKMSWGPNLLIKQGAKLVQETGDILEELPADDRRRLGVATQAGENGGEPGPDAARQLPLSLGPMAPVARALLECLPVETAMHIDELLASLENYSSSEIIAALFELEMLGMVRQLPGKKFVKVW